MVYKTCPFLFYFELIVYQRTIQIAPSSDFRYHFFRYFASNSWVGRMIFWDNTIFCLFSNLWEIGCGFLFQKNCGAVFLPLGYNWFLQPWTVRIGSGAYSNPWLPCQLRINSFWKTHAVIKCAITSMREASIEKESCIFFSTKAYRIAVNGGIFLGIPASLYAGVVLPLLFHYHYYWFRLKNFKTNIFYYQ
jgi:hypothetical protein